MKYDVVIVGAGPAGSTAAKYLADNKKKVLLIDKCKFPREKACGGGLPTRVLKRFPYTEKFLNSISYKSTTYSSSMDYKLEFERKKPLLATVLRKDFDLDLVKVAKKSGIDFIDGKAVSNIKIENDKVSIVIDENKKIESEIVIGCDGMRSIVAEKSNLSKKTDNICICMVQEQKLNEKQIKKYFTDEKTVILMIKTLGIAGYGWIFPKKNYINIGIGEFESAVDSSEKRIKIKEVYEKYIKMLKEKKLIPKEFVINEPKGATIPIFPLKKTYSDRVLLCGDAAGFINPITGEGIYYAMSSGELAAKVCSEAIDNRDFSEEFLSKYQKLWYNDFGIDLKVLGSFNKQWGKNSEKIVRLLSKDKTLAKLVVGITGGRISASRYKMMLYIRYIYASIKDIFT